MSRKTDVGAQRLNEVLGREAAGALACLSGMGRAAFYPAGIPAQAADARGCRIKATAGQVTDGHGNPLPLKAMSSHLVGLDPRLCFLYSGQGGYRPLREAWAERLREEGGDAAFSLPQVTAGLTHGLSLAADLFVDGDTDVLLPEPGWENYDGIFGLRRGGRLRRYEVFDAQGRFHVASLRAALAAVPGKAVLVLNLPGNPTGYTLREDEMPAVLQAVAEHPRPLVVILDDAYHGMVYDTDALQESLFWRLLGQCDLSRQLVVKVDGATKELFFFGGRVGFLTFGCDGKAAEALQEKALTIARVTTSSMPGPSQGLVLAALQDPALEEQIARVRKVLASRFRLLQAEIRAVSSERLRPYPANGGCFILVGLAEDLEPHAVRRRLIDDYSVGVIAVPSRNAVRLAFCSLTEEAIPELVRSVKEVVG